jgi:branched-chain amino acid transport system ATP-binding protein
MMLEVVDVHTYYGQSYILQGLSLTVEEGSVVALLGRNGMGKTTTIRTIMGMTPPRRGTIHEIAGMGIGLVPQGRRIFPSLSVEENLLVAARKVNRPGSWTLERVYELFPILKARRRQGGGLLSGGEQQMLAISRALMTGPDLLALDEPSEGLSPSAVRLVGDIILELRRAGLSMLLVEQNVRMAFRVCDYTYLLSKGRVVHASTPLELSQDQEVLQVHLGVAN